MPPRPRRRSRQVIPYFYGAPEAVAAKASAVAPLMVIGQVGRKHYAPRRIDQLAVEGYQANIIAFLCINLIAGGVSNLPLLTFRGEDEVPEHGLARLVERPSPGRGKARFLQELAGFHLIAGNSFVEAVRAGRRGPPRELYNLRPDRMRVEPSGTGLPRRYVYEVAGQERGFDLDPITGYGDVLHLRDFNPLDDWWGFSPIEAAARWIDLDNAGAELNASTLQNGVNSGFMFSNKGIMSPQQGDEYRAKIQERFGGYRRWGAPMVLGGEWQVQRLNDSLKDMQWTEGMHESARRICAAWNVPHILVVPGESTYANREQARLELWEHTILPFAGLMLGDLVPWFRWLFDDPDLDLRIDVDNIGALEPRRETKRAGALAAFQAKVITLNECRAEFGYDAMPDGDEIEKPQPPPQFRPRQEEDGEEPTDDAEEDDDEGKGWRLTPRIAAGNPRGGQWVSRRRVEDQFREWLRTGKVPVADLAELETVPNGHDAAAPGKGGLAVLAKADASDWFDEALDDDVLAAECLPVIEDIVRRFGERVIERLGLEIAFDVSDPAVAAFLRDFAGDRIRELIGSTTRRDLGTALADVVERGGRFDEMLAAIRRVFKQAGEERARVIATTETTRAASHGTLRGVAQGGVERVRWISTRDPYVRPTHKDMDGQIINAGENFRSPSGAEGPGPGMFGVAAEDILCRCFIQPLADEKLLPDLDAEWKALDDEAQPLAARLEEAVRRGFAKQSRRLLKEARRRFG